MPIFKVQGSSLVSLGETTFEKINLLEPRDIRPLLKPRISEILPNTMIVAEEFRDWEGSDRSIDLLGVDKDANLVVIELKRTKHGGHAELQAIRYSAMISKLTFDQMVAAHQNYLDKNSISESSFNNLIDFFGWSEPDEDKFGQEVKIVILSSDFSAELTTSVIWLRDFGIDISCIRMKPYAHEGEILINVETVIPLPETAEFQVKIQEKIRKERQSRAEKRDYNRYDVSILGTLSKQLNKRNMIFTLIKGIVDNGNSPEEVGDAIREYSRSKVIEKFSGELTAEQVQHELKKSGRGGDKGREIRFFCKDNEIFIFDGNTYIFTNQWGPDTIIAADVLAKRYSNLDITIEKSKSDL